MKINLTVPRRLHLITRGDGFRLYLTVRLFGWRAHWCWRRP